MCFLTKCTLCFYANLNVAIKNKRMDMYHSNVSVLYIISELQYRLIFKDVKPHLHLTKKKRKEKKLLQMIS